MEKEKDAFQYKNKLQALKNKISLLRSRKGLPGSNLSNELGGGKSSCDITEYDNTPKRYNHSPSDSPHSAKSDPDCTANVDNTMN